MNIPAVKPKMDTVVKTLVEDPAKNVFPWLFLSVDQFKIAASKFLDQKALYNSFCDHLDDLIRVASELYPQAYNQDLSIFNDESNISYKSIDSLNEDLGSIYGKHGHTDTEAQLAFKRFIYDRNLESSIIYGATNLPMQTYTDLSGQEWQSCSLTLQGTHTTRHMLDSLETYEDGPVMGCLADGVSGSKTTLENRMGTGKLSSEYATKYFRYWLSELSRLCVDGFLKADSDRPLANLNFDPSKSNAALILREIFDDSTDGGHYLKDYVDALTKDNFKKPLCQTTFSDLYFIKEFNAYRTFDPLLGGPVLEPFTDEGFKDESGFKKYIEGDKTVDGRYKLNFQEYFNGYKDFREKATDYFKNLTVKELREFFFDSHINNRTQIIFTLKELVEDMKIEFKEFIGNNSVAAMPLEEALLALDGIDQFSTQSTFTSTIDLGEDILFCSVGDSRIFVYDDDMNLVAQNNAHSMGSSDGSVLGAAWIEETLNGQNFGQYYETDPSKINLFTAPKSKVKYIVMCSDGLMTNEDNFANSIIKSPEEDASTILANALNNSTIGEEAKSIDDKAIAVFVRKD